MGPGRYRLAGRCPGRAGWRVMSDEYEMSYAHPGSVEGLLQRGRGLGAIRALRDPQGVAVFVYDGIRCDWRLDGVDDRSLYLARLILDLGLSPTPVVDQLAGDEEACVRACEVLELLALAGSGEARRGFGRMSGKAITGSAYWSRYQPAGHRSGGKTSVTSHVLGSEQKPNFRGSPSRGRGSGSRSRAIRSFRGRHWPGSAPQSFSPCSPTPVRKMPRRSTHCVH